MRIALDARPLLEDGGGVFGYTYNLFEALIRLYPEDTFVLFWTGRNKLPKAIHALKAPNTQFLHINVPNKIINGFLAVIRKPQLDTLIARKTKMSVDAIFFPNLGFITHSARIPALVTVHDMSFIVHTELYTHKQQWWHTLINPYRILHSANALCAVSSQTKGDIESLYHVPSEHIYVTPLACPVSPKNDTKRTIPEGPYALLLSAHDARKNASGAIEALLRYRIAYPSSSVRLVCTTTHRALSDLERYIARHHPLQKDMIVLVTNVDDTYRNALLKSAQVLMYPSMYEGFGLPLLEAARWGIPVIASSNSSIPETIQGKAILVDPYSVQEITQAITEIFAHPSPAPSASTQSNDEQYSWDQTARQTKGILEKICA